jgi:hypothetical protein
LPPSIWGAAVAVLEGNPAGTVVAVTGGDGSAGAGARRVR